MATEIKVNRSAVCRHLGYSRQAYYKSVRLKQKQTITQEVVKQKVLAIRSAMPRLGTRKLYFLLRECFKREQLGVGRDKLFAILRSEGLLVATRRRYIKTTQSKHWMHKYPDKVKNLQVTRPEQLWVADITYLCTTNQTYYLHLITDAYSKQVMGYCFSNNLSATSTLQSLKMALKRRKYKESLIHHSDRGLQYCSALYVKTLQQKDIEISMTETGSPYDNAIAERVNGILKNEFCLNEIFEDPMELELQVEQTISTYNSLRPHESNHLLTPVQMHKQNKLRPRTWHKKTTRTREGSCGFLP